MKKEILANCKNILQNRIELTRKSMDEAQASANEESKSSSGDKYETGRAMMHLEREKIAGQLAEAINLKKGLDQISEKSTHDTVQIGSIVITDNGNFFLAVAIGEIEVKGIQYFVISPVSPVGNELLNKKAGDSITVHKRSFKLKEVK